uniref:Uncharacterized protein n=1 Tax=Panagrolaimus sp. PS1159 TaxID=55785 RepID=A0AC35GIZ9_9BILA
MQQLFAIFVFGSFIAAVFAGMQSTAIAGTVTCDGKPEAEAKIELWDKDTIDPDDLMANTTTFSDGGFYLEGKESELTTIDPQVRIFHKCGDRTAKCYKQVTIEIPDEFITDDDIFNFFYYHFR